MEPGVINLCDEYYLGVLQCGQVAWPSILWHMHKNNVWQFWWIPLSYVGEPDLDKLAVSSMVAPFINGQMFSKTPALSCIFPHSGSFWH